VARIKLLIDTDIFIDYLKGMPLAKAVFRSRDIDIYCSILTKKELLSKTGLKDSERKKIISILRDLKTISIDPDISLKYSDLLANYHDNRLQPPDAIIAATAWSKNLPDSSALLTPRVVDPVIGVESKFTPLNRAPSACPVAPADGTWGCSTGVKCLPREMPLYLYFTGACPVKFFEKDSTSGFNWGLFIYISLGPI